MSYQKILLSSIREALPKHIEVFICSASFEQRSKVIPAQLASAHIDKAIVCANKVNFTSLIDDSAQELVAMFGERAKLTELSTSNPLVIADRLQHELRQRPSQSSTTYVVDITSFTHEALLILLRVLYQLVKPTDRIIGVYNSASEYSVGAKDEDMWLTKGVSDIRSVLGYSGSIVPTQKLHLIVLVGFETERAERLIEGYEPTKLSLGYGSPVASISRPLHDINRRFQKKLSDKYKNVLEFTLSLVDILEAKNAVEKQASSLPGYNVVIAPMNTKVSTVGVALAAFENQAFQICYASAEQYNVQSYSRPSDDCYVFEIPVLSAVLSGV